EQEYGETLFNKTGGFDLGYPGNTGLGMCIESLIKENVAHEVLDKKEIGKRFPQFNLEGVERGLYQADAGYLEPDICVPAFISLALKHGAEVKDNCKVESISVTKQHIEVQADGQVYRPKKLIVTAGAWADPLLSQIGLKLGISVSLEQYAFFRPKTEEL